jgi:hypothetical protein
VATSEVNFREPDTGEVRRIPIPRIPVNRGKKEGQSVLAPALLLRVVLPSYRSPLLPIDVLSKEDDHAEFT